MIRPRRSQVQVRIAQIRIPHRQKMHSASVGRGRSRKWQAMNPKRKLRCHSPSCQSEWWRQLKLTLVSVSKTLLLCFNCLHSEARQPRALLLHLLFNPHHLQFHLRHREQGGNCWHFNSPSRRNLQRQVRYVILTLYLQRVTNSRVGLT